MYFCVNISHTHAYPIEVRACLCTHQTVALVWCSIIKWLMMVQGLRCGSGTSGTQTRPPFCVLCATVTVQTPGYEHHILWLLVTARCRLACVHANSIKVNKCIKPSQLVSSEYVQTGKCIYHERNGCRAAARLHLSTRRLC